MLFYALFEIVFSVDRWLGSIEFLIRHAQKDNVLFNLLRKARNRDKKITHNKKIREELNLVMLQVRGMLYKT